MLRGFFTLLVGWLVVFNVPSTARSFRDGTPIYCPLRRTWSSINTPFRPGFEPRAVAWQSITLPLRYASSTFLHCDFPSLASRRCSSKTVYFVITAKNLINNNHPYVGMNINIHIYIVSGILLSINNEINAHKFIMNNKKTFYEHDSLFSLLNSSSRDLKARLDIHWTVSLWHCNVT